MANGYKAPKAGAAALAAELRDQRRQVAASRGAANILSGVIGKGGLRIQDAGSLEIEGGGRVLARDGSISSIDESTRRGATLFGGNLRLFPNFDEYRFARLHMSDAGDALILGAPFDPTTELMETYISVAGSRDTAPQSILLRAGRDVSFQGERVQINPTDGVLTIYNLPSTSGGWALRYNQVGGDWTVALDSSSRRYKTAIEDATLDPAKVLAWRVRSWADKNDPRGARHIGFIAEEIDELTPQFVLRDDQARPDGLQYDRMVAGQQIVLQAQEKRIADQAKEIAALKAENADLKVRVGGAEAKLSGVTAALKKLGINL